MPAHSEIEHILNPHTTKYAHHRKTYKSQFYTPCENIFKDFLTKIALTKIKVQVKLGLRMSIKDTFFKLQAADEQRQRFFSLAYSPLHRASSPYSTWA